MLKQLVQAWFNEVALALIEFDFEIYEWDHNIFAHMNLKGLKIYMTLFVDDFLILSEDNDDLVEIKCRLSEKYEMNDMGLARKFLRIQIEYNDNESIKIH